VDQLDALPRIGQTVFTNGAVDTAIRQFYDPPLPPGEPVIPGRVNLVTAQGSPIFVVVGRGHDPQEAKELANVAAGRLTVELNRYEEALSEFAVQRPATLPHRPAPTIDGFRAVLAGLLGGLILGLGLIISILVWRQPVLDATSAERATGLTVMAALSLGGSEVRGLAHLSRRLLALSADEVVLAGPKAELADRHRIASDLRDLLTGRVMVTDIHGARQRSSHRPMQKLPARGRTITVNVSDGEPASAELTRLDRNALTLLVVPIGIGAARLRRLAEDVTDPTSAGIVLVRKDGHGVAGLTRRRGRTGESASNAA
jgi:hypothetical protein